MCAERTQRTVEKVVECAICGAKNEFVLKDIFNKPQKGEAFDVFHIHCGVCGGRVEVPPMKCLKAWEYHELAAKFGMSGG